MSHFQSNKTKISVNERASLISAIKAAGCTPIENTQVFNCAGQVTQGNISIGVSKAEWNIPGIEAVNPCRLGFQADGDDCYSGVYYMGSEHMELQALMNQIIQGVALERMRQATAQPGLANARVSVTTY